MLGGYLMAVDNKKAALEAAMKNIKKKFGDGAVMRLGENSSLKVDSISTGSLTLDIATGIGGLPRGRIIEIYGPESSGKTTLALHCIAEAQKLGGDAAFVDAEHALDPVYAANLGVDVDSLIVSQPDFGEQALEITEQLVSSGAVDIVVVDSVAALVPKSEIEADMGDSHVGQHARLMSQALRILAGTINKTNCIVIIFINQLREKIGVMYGNPEVTTGGRALKFYSSMRIDVEKIEQLKAQEVNLSALVLVLRLLKIRLRLLSRVLNLILCMEKALARLAKFLIWLFSMILFTRAARGSLTVTAGSVRAEIMLKKSLKMNLNLLLNLNKRLRIKLPRISKKQRKNV